MTFDKWPRQTCTPNLWIALVMSCSRTETRKGLWVLKAICEWRHSGYVYKPGYAQQWRKEDARGKSYSSFSKR